MSLGGLEADVLAGLGALLWAALHRHRKTAGGAAAPQFIPLTIQTGAAAVVAVTTHGPFGEPERAAGRWLPWLRLGAAVALTGVAFGALATGAAAGWMPGGTLTLLRNLSGMAGIGLLSAAVLGGAFGWVAPMAYLLIAEGALAHRSVTPWVWPTRPPHDRGGAICACLVIAARTNADHRARIAGIGPRVRPCKLSPEAAKSPSRPRPVDHFAEVRVVRQPDSWLRCRRRQLLASQHDQRSRSVPCRLLARSMIAPRRLRPRRRWRWRRRPAHRRGAGLPAGPDPAHGQWRALGTGHAVSIAVRSRSRDWTSDWSPWPSAPPPGGAAPPWASAPASPEAPTFSARSPPRSPRSGPDGTRSATDVSITGYAVLIAVGLGALAAALVAFRRADLS